MHTGFVSNLEYGWEEPSVANFYKRLASFCRLIVFDRRGTGLADRVSGVPDLENRIDDVRAIMDAVRSVLPATLFTDVVGSTARAAELGDRRWRELLQEHQALVPQTPRTLPRP
jgi:class 3 adenylate cyclase